MTKSTYPYFLYTDLENILKIRFELFVILNY